MPILYGFTDDEISEFPCVILSLRVSGSSDVTEKPVETGITISDHVVTKNDRVSATIHVSPVMVSGQGISVRDAKTLLSRIQKSRTVCTVSGGPGDLESMEELILNSWEVERSAEQGTAAEIQLEFVQLRYAVSQTSAPLPRRPRDQRRVSRGAQSTAPQPRRSLAAALFEDMTGMGLIHSTTPAR